MMKEPSGESETCQMQSVEGKKVAREGAVNSETRRRPWKAEVTAAQSMRASMEGDEARKKERRERRWPGVMGWRKGLVREEPWKRRMPASV